MHACTLQPPDLRASVADPSSDRIRIITTDFRFGGEKGIVQIPHRNPIFKKIWAAPIRAAETPTSQVREAVRERTPSSPPRWREETFSSHIPASAPHTAPDSATPGHLRPPQPPRPDRAWMQSTLRCSRASPRCVDQLHRPHLDSVPPWHPPPKARWSTRLPLLLSEKRKWLGQHVVPTPSAAPAPPAAVIPPAPAKRAKRPSSKVSVAAPAPKKVAPKKVAKKPPAAKMALVTCLDGGDGDGAEPTDAQGGQQKSRR
jgi:hypothetical protein